MFDANDLLNSSHDVGLDDKIVPIPEGEYLFQIAADDKAIAIEKGVVEKEGERKGQPWARVDIMCELVDPTGAVKAAIGRDPKIRHGIMLDLNENGGFDHAKQKNVRTGALLTATGLNAPGWSFSQLRGKSFKGKVKISISTNNNPFNEIVTITAA